MSGEERAALLARCGTCRHWKPVTEGYSIGYSATYREGESWEDESARQMAVESLYGTCQAVAEIPDAEKFEPPNEPPVAFTMDGSHYRASLHTQAHFGCVLHEAEPAKASLVER